MLVLGTKSRKEPRKADKLELASFENLLRGRADVPLMMRKQALENGL